MDEEFKCKRDSLFQEAAKNNKHRDELNECIWEEASFNNFLKNEWSNKIEYRYWLINLMLDL